MRTIVLLALVLGLADPVSQARRIFDVADSVPPAGQSRLAVVGKLAKLAPPADADYRVQHAFVVAMMHENRLNDALTAATRLVKSKPDFIAARRARAWLLLASHKNSDALTEMEALAKLLPGEGAPGADELPALEMAQFLGTAIGYLEGPVADDVNTAVRSKYKTRIVALLSSKCRSAFLEQEQAVAQQHNEFRKKDEEARSKVDNKKRQDLQTVDNKQQDLEMAKTELKSQAAETSKALRTRWEALTNELSQAVTSYQSIESQSLSLRSQLSQARSELRALENPRTDQKGNVSSADREARSRNSPRLREIIVALDNQIARAIVSMNQLQQRGALIEQQMAEVMIAGQQVGENFEAQKQVFGKQDKMLAGKRQRAEKSIPEKTTKLNERYRAYRLYDDFPYEAEKQRILKAFNVK